MFYNQYINKKNACLLFLIHLGIHFNTFTQQNLPTFAWRTHLSYFQVRELTQSSTAIYAATANGLFKYDYLNDKTVLLDNIFGLSDTNIGGLLFSQKHQSLIIGYENGNIDVISEDLITNIRTLLNTNNQNKIYHISLKGDTAFISTNNGIALLDLSNLRLIDIYENLGQSGESVPIFSSVSSQNALYTLSNEGINVVSLAPNNIPNDFNNWQRLLSHNQNPITQFTVFNNELIYARKGLGIFLWQDGQEIIVLDLNNTTVNHIYSDAQVLIISIDTGLIFSDLSLIFTSISYPNASPLSCLKTADQKLWVGDKQGLFAIENNQIQKSVILYSPFSPYSDRLFIIDNQLFSISSFTEEQNFSSLSIFQNEVWKNYSHRLDNNGYSSILNHSKLTGLSQSSEANIFHLLTAEDGLWRFDKTNLSFEHTANNFENYRLTDIALSPNLETWISSLRPDTNSQTILFLKRNNASFIPVNLNQQADIYKLVIDVFDQKWLASDRGLIFFKDPFNSQLLRPFDNFADNEINDLVIDRDNAIWLATNNGLAAFQSFEDLENNIFDISPFIPTIDGAPVLNGIKINALSVDGGNRKWIGTEQGLFLFNSDVDVLIKHYSTENSFLLSNTIHDIAINGLSGEVFISTDKGIVSFQSDSENPASNFENVKIFPNPVPPNYEGFITISGLVDNSDLRITDIQGNLVWQGRSKGGKISWNGFIYNGFKPKTGIYFIFVNDINNTQHFLGKLAIIH